MEWFLYDNGFRRERVKKLFMGIMIKEESIHYYFQNFKVHRGEG